MTDSAGNEFSLALPHPSFNTLLGPTGSGKTSLLRRIAGLEPSPPGSVRLGDRSLDTLPPRLRNVSMVYQQFVNYPSLTAFENIASPLRCQGVSRDAVTARVLEVARSLHIEELLNRLPESLSGGQQQRVALGRALAKDSDLVLLDEPLANLDYKLREELRRVIPRLFKDRDATVLYATSDPQEALELASNTIVLSQGRVAQTGPADYLYAAPANRDVAEILTHPPINVMAGHLTPSELVIPEILTTPRPAHAGQLQAGPVLVGVRPGDLLLTDAPGATRLHAQVELSEVSGSETFLHLKAGGCALVAHEPGLHPRPLGASLDVFAVPSTFLLFDEAGQTLAAPGAPNA